MYKIDNVKDIDNIIVPKIIELINIGEKYFLFDAEMGFGKTTIINKICNFMNVVDFTSSPTYSIINEYSSVNYGKILHLDLYRLNSITELYDIGIEEYIDSDYIFMVEWPNYFKYFLNNQEFIDVKIFNNNNIRNISIKKTY